MKRVLVTKEKLGDKYPLSVSPIFLEKDSRNGLYVVHKKKRFNLNGVAKKGESLDSIWLDNPEIGGTKKPLSILFDICSERGLL